MKACALPLCLLSLACGTAESTRESDAGVGGDPSVLYDDSLRPYAWNPEVHNVGPEWITDWVHFWSSNGAFRIPVDGGPVEETGPYDSARTADITSDGEFVYWPYQSSVIKYSDATATYEELPMRFSTLTSLRIAVSDDAIYVAQATCSAVLALDKQGRELWLREIPEYENRGSAADLAADKDHVYCARGASVFRISADGQHHEAIATGGDSLNALALGEGRVYYAEGNYSYGYAPSTIYEWSEDGGTRILFQADRSLYITALALDPARRRLYWDMLGRIWSLGLDDLRAEQVTITASAQQRSVTQSRDKLFWVEGHYLRQQAK